MHGIVCKSKPFRQGEGREAGGEGGRVVLCITFQGKIKDPFIHQSRQ